MIRLNHHAKDLLNNTVELARRDTLEKETVDIGEINEKVKVNLTLNNILNHKHVEIIGGPSLGRIALLRLTTNL